VGIETDPQPSRTPTPTCHGYTSPALDAGQDRRLSGLVGLYRLDGRPVDPADLDRMVGASRHRGPDGQGIWRDGPVGLGQVILRTTRAHRPERLPFGDAAAGLVLAGDVRLDNRDELLAAFGLDARRGAGCADGELILWAYRAWGQSCVERLAGDFAFALWDAARRVLFCGRDRMGVKPLYYYLSDRLFAAASEIKDLLCLPEVPRRLDEARVIDYLLPAFHDTARTFYRGIVRLPPAHAITVGGAGGARPSPRRYWSAEDAREVRHGSDAAYAEHFRALFARAVRTRLHGEGPVAAALSGGLDSSAIACMARDLLAGEGRLPLRTFTAIFPGLPEADRRRVDEREYVDAVVATGGFEHHFVEADSVGPLEDATAVVRQLDEANHAPNLYVHRALYAQAHRHGARVFLDGVDGDTTVSHGLAYLAELAGRGRFRKMAAEAMAITRRAGRRHNPARVAWDYGLRPLVPVAAVAAWRKAPGRSRCRVPGQRLLNPGFARRAGAEDRARAALADTVDVAGTAREDHRQGLASGLIPHVLEVADKAAAAFAVEPRYPFFDHRLIEFCVGLPGDQKLRSGWTRFILRSAMTGILPEAVRRRTDKANLTPTFTRGLIEHDRAAMEEVILRDGRLLGEYVDLQSLREILARFLSTGGTNGSDALALFRAVNLGLWLREARLTS
jgi:asparagine synthase (glutamine-hydrolysing)